MNADELSSFDIVKHWLKQQLTSIMSVQSCQLMPGNSLIVNTWTGVSVNVYLLNEVVRTRAIKKVLQEATEIGIGSLFILDADLIPQPNTRFDPAEWLLALHALTHDRIYAYDIDEQGPKLLQIHFEPIGSTGAHITKYGPNVRFEQLRFLKVSVKPKYIKGDWQIADFGLSAFWRDPYNPKRTEYRRPDNREYQWRQWSQTTWQQAQTQQRFQGEAPPPPPRYQATPKDPLHSAYQLLAVDLDATREEVKAAFRKLALVYHPDTSELPQEEAARKFREVTEAYDYIREYRKW